MIQLLYSGCEQGYREPIEDFVDLCSRNINISKTKKMVEDFRWRRPKPDLVTILRSDGEYISSYRYHTTAG